MVSARLRPPAWFRLRALGLLLLLAGPPPVWPAAPASATAQLLPTLADARLRGCSGRGGSAAALRPQPALDQVARQLADGTPPAEAFRSAGYRAVRTFQLSLAGHGSLAAVAQTLARGYCEPLSDPGLTEVGAHQRGGAWWIVLAAPFTPPPASAAAEVGARVLALTNQARGQPRRCGAESFPAVPPLRASDQLAQAAAAHAQDMARHGFMAHEGRDGSQPHERIGRAGYRWRSVGENVAAGQAGADEVVRDWLRSPGHCANIMSPKFTEMGLAFAANPGTDAGLYWAQTFGRPR